MTTIVTIVMIFDIVGMIVLTYEGIEGIVRVLKNK